MIIVQTKHVPVTHIDLRRRHSYVVQATGDAETAGRPRDGYSDLNANS